MLDVDATMSNKNNFLLQRSRTEHAVKLNSQIIIFTWYHSKMLQKE